MPGLWRHGDFLRLWSAQSVSALGSQVTLVALPLTALLVLHARPYQVALLGTAETLPNLLFGIPFGVYVDRLRRRPLLVAADASRAALLASAPVAYALGALTLPHLFAIAVVNGSLSVLFEIGAQAYLPAVVDRTQLLEANGRFAAARSVAWAAGPAAGGGLISLVTAPVALVADAASYVASAGLLASIGAREERPEPTGRARHQLREDARYVLRDPLMRPLLVGHALANLALGLVWAVAIVYAVQALGVTAGALGLVLSLGQLGGLAGGVLGGRLAARIGVGRTVATSLVLFGPAALALAAAPRSAPIPFLALGWILENLGRSLYGVSATSLRQALVPELLQARASGFVTTAGTGAFPLGTALGSALAAGLGLRQTMLAAAVVGFLPVLPIVASPLRSVVDLAGEAA